MRALVCVCARVRVCVRARVSMPRVCVRARVRACVCARVRLCACVLLHRTMQLVKSRASLECAGMCARRMLRVCARACAYATVYSKYGPTPPTWSTDQYARVHPVSISQLEKTGSAAYTNMAICASRIWSKMMPVDGRARP